MLFIILFCNFRTDLNTLEPISSTDKKCLWKRQKAPVLEQFQAQPTKFFCCVHQDRLPALSQNTVVHLRNRLTNCNNGTAVAKHRNRNLNTSRVPLRQLKNKILQVNSRELHNEDICSVINNNHRPDDFENCTQNFIQSITNNAKCSKEIIFLRNIKFNLADCCQNTLENKIICDSVLQTAIRTKDSKLAWQQERKFRITGSKCYSVYTYSKEDWSEKACKYFWSKEFSNKYTRHGNQYERVARNMYAKETNLLVQECRLIVSDIEPWMAYSPIGVVIKDFQVFRLLEIKCPYEIINTTNEILLTKCKFLYATNNILHIKKKHQYYAQIQFGVALLNLKDCDFVIYSNISHSIRIINVSLGKQYVEDLLSNLKKKYFEKMLHEICRNSRVP